MAFISSLAFVYAFLSSEIFLHKYLLWEDCLIFLKLLGQLQISFLFMNDQGFGIARLIMIWTILCTNEVLFFFNGTTLEISFCKIEENLAGKS